MGAVWHESGTRRSGWRAWLWRAAHHFLPEDPAPAEPDRQTEAPSAEGAATSPVRGPEHETGSGSADGQPSLDHVLRTAAEARALPEDGEE